MSWSFCFMRDLVDAVGTAIREHDGHIYVPDLKRYRSVLL